MGCYFRYFSFPQPELHGFRVFQKVRVEWERTNSQLADRGRYCCNGNMNRDQVIATLRAHEQELKDAGVVRLSLFGSMARGEPDPGDVDIAVRLAQSFCDGGFDYFGRMEELKQQLSQLLGCKVDVVEEPVHKERFQKEIDRDRALAF